MRTLLTAALAALLAATALAQEAERYFYSGSDMIYVCTADSDQGTSNVAVTGGDYALTSVVVSSNTGTVTTADLGIQAGASITMAAAQTTWSVDLTTLTSIVVLTNVGTVNITGHGLAVGEIFTVSGATVDTDLNGAYAVATVPGVDSFTIATVSVADATYNESGLQGVNSDADLAGTYTVQTWTSDTVFTITTADVADGTYILGVSFTTTVPLSAAAIWKVRRYGYDASANLISSAWAGGSESKSKVCANRATLAYE